MNCEFHGSPLAILHKVYIDLEYNTLVFMVRIEPTQIFAMQKQLAFHRISNITSNTPDGLYCNSDTSLG